MIKQVKNKCGSIVIQVVKFDHGVLKENVPKWLRQQRTTGSSNMAVRTGNSYISGTMIDNNEIPTGNLVFSTM